MTTLTQKHDLQKQLSDLQLQIEDASEDEALKLAAQCAVLRRKTRILSKRIVDENRKLREAGPRFVERGRAQ